MTYDILFLRVLPGRTFDETLEEVNSAYDPDADLEPMNLTVEQRADWDRLLQRISREAGPVTTEVFPYSLTLWRDGPAGQSSGWLVPRGGDSRRDAGQPLCNRCPTLADQGP